MRKRPMAEKIGDALKKAIARESVSEEVRKKRGEESLLLNPTRLSIFQYLCKKPCSKLRVIARELDLAVPTADWHLRKLSEKGLISAKKVAKSKVFYPAEMIDSEDIEVLTMLSGDKAKLICSTIAANPGISQSELGKKVGMYQQEVGWYTSRLTEKGVLSRIIDGRYRRYYISEDLEGILRSDRKRRNHFKKTLLRALKSDGAKPEIIRSRKDTLVIELGVGKEKTILKVNLNLIPRFLQKDIGD
ncbi:MAG: winged helix-turn-helix transcriptional regulator [Thermoplasmata archaeon]|nr:MAG: winged helix-turn-helix transcriptional regulator [Thermoplasmata archaeon]